MCLPISSLSCQVVVVERHRLQALSRPSLSTPVPKRRAQTWRDLKCRPGSLGICIAVATTKPMQGHGLSVPSGLNLVLFTSIWSLYDNQNSGSNVISQQLHYQCGQMHSTQWRNIKRQTITEQPATYRQRCLKTLIIFFSFNVFFGFFFLANSYPSLSYHTLSSKRQLPTRLGKQTNMWHQPDYISTNCQSDSI